MMSEKQTGIKEHRNYLDLLRFFGCVLVIYIHISGNFINDIILINSKTYYITQFLRDVALVAVPLFVMVSGSVNLGRPISMNKLKVKIKKLSKIYIYWLLIPIPVFVSLNSWMKLDWNSIKYTIENLAQYSYHLWYVPMLIGLYMMTPILNQIVKSKSIARYLIMIYVLLFSALTVTDILKAFNILDLRIYFSDIRVILPIFVGYFVLGYYIERYNIKASNRVLMVAMGGALSAIFIVSVLMPYFMGLSVDFDYRNTVIYLVLTTTIFLIAKNKFNRSYSFIRRISDNSLGIYLVHLLYVNLFYFNLLKHIDIHPLILIPIASVVVLIACYVTVVAIKKIPILKNVFG